MKSIWQHLFKVARVLWTGLAIAPLLLFVCLWLTPSPIAWAQSSPGNPTDGLEATERGIDTVELRVVDNKSAPVEPSVAVDIIQAVSDEIENPEADPTDIFSPVVKAMAATETTLQDDAAQTSIFEALADVSEAADEQALTAKPKTLEGSVQSWFTSVKAFLELE